MDELDRIRAEYARRQQDARCHDWYSRFSPADLFIHQERERELLRVLRRYATGNWYNTRVLDVGCGNGHPLARFVGYGIAAQNLAGVDILTDRLETARARFPNIGWLAGDAGALPFDAGAFELVLQFTLFSSILDNALRRQMAGEMLRVLKPRGLILWYDYRLNPRNAQTRGVEQDEIRDLFPNCEWSFRRLTLAPPITRALAPHSWLACALLSLLPFLKTHYLAVIRKR